MSRLCGVSRDDASFVPLCRARCVAAVLHVLHDRRCRRHLAIRKILLAYSMHIPGVRSRPPACLLLRPHGRPVHKPRTGHRPECCDYCGSKGSDFRALRSTIIPAAPREPGGRPVCPASGIRDMKPGSAPDNSPAGSRNGANRDVSGKTAHGRSGSRCERPWTRSLELVEDPAPCPAAT